jgi:putative uncharacterized protein FNV0866
MEKENVLEIEYQEAFDSVVFRIKYQNDEILKRGNFHDEETGVESCWTPEYVKHNKLYIQGKEKDKDNIVLLVDKEDFKKILEIVNKINEKYGIPKRWRGKRSDKYFTIFGDNEIAETTDNYFPEDQRRYEWGNYFKTKEEAEKVKAELDKFWAKVRAGEIGG